MSAQGEGDPVGPLARAAAALASLGHPTRLGVYLLLREAGPQGLNVGALQTALAVPDSTLSHHLERLRRGGVVEAERRERFWYYRVRPEVDRALGEGLSALASSSPPPPLP